MCGKALPFRDDAILENSGEAQPRRRQRVSPTESERLSAHQTAKPSELADENPHPDLTVGELLHHGALRLAVLLVMGIAKSRSLIPVLVFLLQRRRYRTGDRDIRSVHRSQKRPERINSVVFEQKPSEPILIHPDGVWS
jgi:hypothetical protein